MTLIFLLFFITELLVLNIHWIPAVVYLFSFIFTIQYLQTKMRKMFKQADHPFSTFDRKDKPSLKNLDGLIKEIKKIWWYSWIAEGFDNMPIKMHNLKVAVSLTIAKLIEDGHVISFDKGSKYRPFANYRDKIDQFEDFNYYRDIANEPGLFMSSELAQYFDFLAAKILVCDDKTAKEGLRWFATECGNEFVNRLANLPYKSYLESVKEVVE